MSLGAIFNFEGTTERARQRVNDIRAIVATTTLSLSYDLTDHHAKKATAGI